MTEQEVVEILARCDFEQVYAASPDLTWEGASPIQKHVYYESARRYVTRLRAAGLVVVRSGELDQLRRLAAASIIDTSPLTDAEIARTGEIVAEHGMPATPAKDTPNA